MGRSGRHAASRRPHPDGSGAGLGILKGPVAVASVSETPGRPPFRAQSDRPVSTRRRAQGSSHRAARYPARSRSSYSEIGCRSDLPKWRPNRGHRLGPPTLSTPSSGLPCAPYDPVRQPSAQPKMTPASTGRTGAEPTQAMHKSVPPDRSRCHLCSTVIMVPRWDPASSSTADASRPALRTRQMKYGRMPKRCQTVVRRRAAVADAVARMPVIDQLIV